MGVAIGARPAQQQSGSAQSGQQTPPAQAAPPAQTPPPAQQQSLGDAARKNREQQKNAPQASKTYTNEDISAIHSTGISTVGQSTTPAAPAAPNAPGTPATPDRKKMEADWRKKFGDARQRLTLAQKDLDIMQRELAVLQVQFYPDPNQAMQQQHDRSDINEKLQKIEDKKAEVAKLEQAITDLQDELRRAGGDPSWAY
jgi:chromosome segregation ATPase